MSELQICQRCSGSGMLEAQLENLATCTYSWHVIGCPDCQGLGWRGDETGRVYASVELHKEHPYGSPQLHGYQDCSPEGILGATVT